MNNTKMYQEIFQEPEKLSTCLECNWGQIHTVAKLLQEKKPTSVIISARGTSCNAGKYAKYLMEIYLGIPVSIAAPSTLTRYGGKLYLDNTLVIGISQSGAAADVCSLIDRGNETGAITIAITNTEGSLLAEHAQYHFYCCADKEEAHAATKTFVTQMELLTLLTAAWTEDARMEEQIRQLPNLTLQVLMKRQRICELIQKWRFVEECFILARGLSYPVALECEIKIQETSFIHAQAFSTANFAHGPVAMVSRRVPLLAIACDAETDENVIEAIHRVQAEGAEVLIITNKPEIAGMSEENALLLDTDCEGLKGVFAAATAIQLLACELAVLCGQNPDAPRGLTKVTVTR